MSSEDFSPLETDQGTCIHETETNPANNTEEYAGDLLSTLKPEFLSDWAKDHIPNNFDHIKGAEARDRVAKAIIAWREISESVREKLLKTGAFPLPNRDSALSE